MKLKVLVKQLVLFKKKYMNEKQQKIVTCTLLRLVLTNINIEMTNISLQSGFSYLSQDDQSIVTLQIINRKHLLTFIHIK